MATVVKTRIMRIGNSRAIRIPKALLDQAGLRRDVVLTAQPGAHPVQVGDEAVVHDGELAPVGLTGETAQALAHGLQPVFLVRVQAVHEGR